MLVNPFGPLQENVPLPLPPSCTLDTLQFKVPPVACAPGSVVLAVTTAASVAVHPVCAFITVRTYVPAAFTVTSSVPPPDTMPGPLQLKVTLGVVEDPSNTTCWLLRQVICESSPALALGTPPPLIETGNTNAHWLASVIVTL